MSASDIILAGVPRSGTTLTCHLLNKLPNVVALHEPITPAEYFGLETKEVIGRLRGFFLEQRESLLRDGVAASKSAGGIVPDNSIKGIDKKTGQRKSILNSKILVVDKPLTVDFDLAVKQPNFFTAKLQDLVHHFQCYAIIRNPLSALLSWNSVEMRVSRGYAPGAEAFDKDLSIRLSSEKDLLSRQLILIAWYFEKYARILPAERIVRYEDLIASGGRELAKISVSAKQLDERLVSKNNSRHYDQTKKNTIAEKLLNSDGRYFEFYDKQEILRLL